MAEYSFVISSDILVKLLIDAAHAKIRRISDDAVKPPGFHRVGEALLPVKRVDAPYFLGVYNKLCGVTVRTDQRIAALDVIRQVGQSTVAEGKLTQGKALVGLTL